MRDMDYGQTPTVEDEKPKRKRGLLVNLIITAVIILGLIGGVVANAIYNSSHYKVEFYRLESDKINSRVRIVYLTDVHLSEYGENNSTLIEDVKSLSPDLIITGGDMVVDSVSDYSGMLELCSSLAEIAPLYGVPGNHENIKIYQHGERELIQNFTDAGLKLLINSAEKVEINGEMVTVMGVDGSCENFEEYGSEKYMEYCEESFDGCYTVCVSHVPYLFAEKLSQYNCFDLGLAGHVHGGILILPKIGGLFSREEGWLPEYTSGEYKLDNNATLIVSRGLGFSHSIPRLNNVPELSVVDIY